MLTFAQVNFAANSASNTRTYLFAFRSSLLDFCGILASQTWSKTYKLGFSTLYYPNDIYANYNVIMRAYSNFPRLAIRSNSSIWATFIELINYLPTY